MREPEETTGDPPTSAGAPGTLPGGLRVYAIGDIHGRFDLLERLAAEIARDLEHAPPDRAVEIYLGDYIDRGPQSREVIAWLTGSPPLGQERICLMGNHEALLLNALANPAGMSNWLFNGGADTVASYVADPRAAIGASPGERLRSAFLAAFPESHRDFLARLPRKAALGGYLFVHAGIRPGVPIAAQDPEDLVWIRQPFLSSNADFGPVIVHGHTPVRTPEVRPNRINIDTGAVFRGRLTCLVLEADTRRFLQVGHAA
jgi:serine/threonine protein phosphatase 1